MLIKIKNYFVASLTHLERLTYKFIFEPENMDIKERRLYEESIKRWHDKANLTSDEAKRLLHIDNAVIACSKGKFDHIKHICKHKGVDYKKLYNVEVGDAA